MAIEIPNYKVIKKENNIELREYQSYVMANVKVAADSYGSAGSHGFGPLADYIFGNNTKRNKIKMTAPVSTEQSEQIELFSLCFIFSAGLLLFHGLLRLQLNKSIYYRTQLGSCCCCNDLGGIEAKLAQVSNSVGYTMSNKIPKL